MWSFHRSRLSRSLTPDGPARAGLADRGGDVLAPVAENPLADGRLGSSVTIARAWPCSGRSRAMSSPSIEGKPLFERTHFLAGFSCLGFSCLKLYRGDRNQVDFAQILCHKPVH